MSDSVINLVSQITELDSTSKELCDEDLDKALNYIIKIMTKPDVIAAKIPALVNELQALSIIFGMRANYYIYLDKPEPNSIEYKRKNTFKAIEDKLDKMVAALKYTAKAKGYQ